MIVFITFFIFVVNSQPPPKPVPAFSPTETGRFVRTYSLTLGQSVELFHFQSNTQTQRAYCRITNYKTNGLLSEHWLIYKPEGAPEDEESSKGFVQFLVEDPNPYDNNTEEAYCEYKTGKKIHFGSGLNYPPVAFPDHWDRQDIVEIKSWIEIPRHLSYQGVVAENGFKYDTWLSTGMCSISDIGTLPCNKISFLENTNIPTSHFLADESSSQFRNSWWLDDNFLFYSSRPTEIYPPKNWRTRCWNTQNGFLMSSYGRAIVATPAHPDNFTIQLRAAPVESLGPVNVFFMFDGESCTDCIAFEDENGNPIEEIVFTNANWNKPVFVSAHYLKEGESYFFVLGYGGGYEIPHYSGHFSSSGSFTISQGSRALTCPKGQAGYGCD